MTEMRENLFMQTSFGFAKIGQIRFIAVSLQKPLKDAVVFVLDIRFRISPLGCFKNDV